MLVMNESSQPPVAAALLLVGDHGGGDGRDGGLGAVDVQGEEFVVEPEQIDVQLPQVVQPGAGGAPGAAAHRPRRPDRMGCGKASLIVAGDELGQRQDPLCLETANLG